MPDRNKGYSIKALRIMLLTFAITLILQFFFTLRVYSEEKSVEDLLIEQDLQSNEAKTIENQLQRYSGNGIKEIIPDFDPQRIIQDVSKGKFEFSPAGMLNRVLMYIFKEIYQNINILVKLIILVVLCAILKNLQASFLSESVGEMAFYACYIILVSILTVSFNTALTLGKGVIDNMVIFMQATVPVLITMLVSGGNFSTAGIFQPLLITIVEIGATLMGTLFIPLIFLSTVVSIVGNISEKVQVSKLASFIKQITAWSLGIILTIFIGVVSIQGSLGAVVDGVTSKTAKFAIGAFIPVAGKYLADAADAVISCALLIKNAAGVAVMLGVIAICLVPMLKILALILLYKITCVLIEPISEKRITNCINEIAGSLTFILGIVASVTFMFLLAVTAIITAGNVSAMIR